MRKMFSVLIAVLLFVTPYAQAKTCYGISCNYIDGAGNSGFGSGFTGWNIGGPGANVPAIVTEACYFSNAAEMQNGEWVERPAFYVDNAYSDYKLYFRLFLPGDTNNFYDEIKVRVTNTGTGVYEEQVYHGSSYTSHCGYELFDLANDYDYQNVKVTFTSGGFSSHNWQIDDVGFFAYY